MTLVSLCLVFDFIICLVEFLSISARNQLSQVEQKRSVKTAMIFSQALGLAKISLQRCSRLDFLGVRGINSFKGVRKVLCKTSNSDFFINYSSEKKRSVTKEICLGVTPPTIGLILTRVGASKKNRFVIRTRLGFEITGLGAGDMNKLLRTLN